MNSIIDTKFLGEIKELVNSAKQRVVTSINIAMVYTYYEIGRRIVEQEQKGLNRAEYGTELLYQLSIELSKEFGKGYSVHNIKLFRKFFLAYQKRETVFLQSKIIDNFKTKTLSYNNSKKQIVETVFTKSKINNNFNNYPITSDGHRFFLNWASYILLMRIILPTKEELISLLKDGD